MSGEGASGSAKIALVVLAFSTPVVVWWLIGPLSESVSRGEPQFLVEPPSVSPTAERVAGIVGVVAVCACLAVLTIEARRGRLERRWRPVAVCVVLSGCAIGAAARLITAGSDGANIGGALALYGLPAILLPIWALVALRFGRSRQRRLRGS